MNEEYQKLQKSWLMCRECAMNVKDKKSGETYATFPFPALPPHIMRILEDLSSTIGEVGWVSEEIRRLWPLDGDSKIRAEVFSREVGKKDMAAEGTAIPAQEAWSSGKPIHWNSADDSTDILRYPVSSRLHFWVLAEITATITACLSVVRPELGVSFPAAKTNLTLHCPTEGNSEFLSELVHSIAGERGIDVVQLDAQDLAEIAGDYLGEGSNSSDSIRSLGYETYRFKSELQEDIEEVEENEEGPDEEDVPANSSSFGFPTPKSSSGSAKHPSLLTGAVHVLNLGMPANAPFLKALGMQMGSGRDRGPMASSSNPFSARPQFNNEVHWEDMKLIALLEALVDSDDLKRNMLAAKKSVNEMRNPQTKPAATDSPKFFDFSLNTTSPVGVDLSAMLSKDAQSKISLTLEIQPSKQNQVKHAKPPYKKIILIRDIKELGATHRGSQILQKLQDIIRKRRAEGEQIMIVGTTSSVDLIPEMSKSGIRSLQSEGDDSYSRTIVLPPLNIKDTNYRHSFLPNRSDGASMRTGAEMRRNSEINFRHIQDMLRRLDPVVSAGLIDPECALQLPFPPTNHEIFMDRVLSFDQVHRIALTAIGIHLSQPKPALLSNAHLSLAMSLLDLSDEVKFNWITWENMERIKESKPTTSATKSTQEVRRDRILSKANKHEKRLLSGVINPEKIKTTFSDVHAPKETTEALRTLTSLSLLRPEAFRYGVLATDKIPGLLLYGPPGTGKTLLAKAVAKESGATVLEVSGSEVYDMYVGEGEKNVRAIFSLARKLSPCVVFIDEADAIFGSRDGGRQRTSHREIINQFLKEWDGMNDLSVFIMVATNRPFDLDDAVLRRLPRRLLVDLPTQADRQKILEIHLKDELLDKSVNLEDLARRTALYSGSDLKNMAVAAALACVREENENAAIAAAKALSATETSKSGHGQQTHQAEQDVPKLVPGQKYQFPEKRTLHARHFDKAMQEISASISEDMSSLSAIKKFDEQFGDRKGRRKKSAYGFGIQPERDEAAARVRT